MNAPVSLSSGLASMDASIADVDMARRFGGVARLYGAAALARFQKAHVCVIGVGGVGSWVVEAMARSAIGRITMIDLDNVAESNVNRQLHALTGNLGKAKVTALAERIAEINPCCEVREIEDFIAPDNLDAMIGSADYDYVVDAIDSVVAKTALIAYCRAQNIRLITIGGAGGQIDPTCIEIRDLARTEQEPLLAKVRKRLRSQHGFPRGDKSRFGIDAVFSTEPLRLLQMHEQCALGGMDSTEVGSEGSTESAAGKGTASAGVSGLNCAGFGSAVTVTASFGLVAASRVLRRLAEEA